MTHSLVGLGLAALGAGYVVPDLARAVATADVSYIALTPAGVPLLWPLRARGGVLLIRTGGLLDGVACPSAFLLFLASQTGIRGGVRVRLGVDVCNILADVNGAISGVLGLPPGFRFERYGLGRLGIGDVDAWFLRHPEVFAEAEPLQPGKARFQ